MSILAKVRLLARSFLAAFSDIATEVRHIKAPYWVAMISVAAIGDAITWLVK